MGGWSAIEGAPHGHRTRNTYLTGTVSFGDASVKLHCMSGRRKGQWSERAQPFYCDALLRARNRRSAHFLLVEWRQSRSQDLSLAAARRTVIGKEGQASCCPSRPYERRYQSGRAPVCAQPEHPAEVRATL